MYIYTAECEDKLLVKRVRYVIMTRDRTQIFCTAGSSFDFRDLEEVGCASIKTYMSEKKAFAQFKFTYKKAT